MATLSLQHIDKIYPNHVQAVYDFNLEVKDKEFIVFVGPSGCGKSTTLRMIAGFESISNGKLYIDGIYVNHLEPKDRNIAMVCQNYALYPHMTVYENLAFALKLRKLPCPVTAPLDPQYQFLDQQEAQCRKEIKKIVRLFTKNQDSKTLLQRYTEQYQKLFALEEERQSHLVPVKGIDNEQINRLKKENVSLEKDINYAKKKMSHHQEQGLEERGNALVSQKQIQIEENVKRIEWLQRNEIPLTKERHLSKDEMDLRINKVAASIDLTRYLFRLPSALSGGQRQRVALGRAMVREPKVFLMDEPLSNLDAKLRAQTRGVITKIHKAVGATTIYVTHDQTEAMTMADRIVCMKDGRIQQIGTPEELYQNPDNKFVAGFIGSPAMNFLEGKVEQGRFVFATKEEESQIALPLNDFNQSLLIPYEGKKVILGVRPEAIHLANERTKKNGVLPVKNDYYELLGYEYFDYCYLNGQRIVFKTTSRQEIEGKDLSLVFDAEKLCFFDPLTEKRIRNKEEK